MNSFIQAGVRAGSRQSNYPGGVTLFATGIPLGVENKAEKVNTPAGGIPLGGTACFD